MTKKVEDKKKLKMITGNQVKMKNLKNKNITKIRMSYMTKFLNKIH